ncbi:hypothetical protein NKI19_22205 [Mesorhizobium sp. M0751]|uniref:hypothetical protein n=1 Tax=unclassified Mesorhizobium TaxID=325217 RepID=UPI0033383C12
MVNSDVRENEQTGYNADLILYGSVFTGWHYAVDGYASIVVVSVIWWATGRLVRE